jgi:transposase-like protein
MILILGYLWINQVSNKAAMAMTGHSSDTITNYYRFFRRLLTEMIMEEDMVIGGESITVEIDESVFGSRKYNRGHHVEGVWVVGGVERTEERNVFFKIVKKRNEKTLLNIIQKHVHPESIIITDLWRGYYNLSKIQGYEQHLLVNHSNCFKDPVTGAHTNTIEGSWNGMKMNIKPKNRTEKELGDHLFEFIWRRQNRSNLWESFIAALREVHYV